VARVADGREPPLWYRSPPAGCTLRAVTLEPGRERRPLAGRSTGGSPVGVLAPRQLPTLTSQRAVDRPRYAANGTIEALPIYLVAGRIRRTAIQNLQSRERPVPQRLRKAIEQTKRARL
jgi:hypothetical protein